MDLLFCGDIRRLGSIFRLSPSIFLLAPKRSAAKVVIAYVQVKKSVQVRLIYHLTSAHRSCREEFAKSSLIVRCLLGI